MTKKDHKEDMHTCAILVETRRAWNFLLSGSNVYPRLGHRDYSKCDKVVFYNHDELRVAKADLISTTPTTISRLTPGECEMLGAPNDTDERLAYFKEFFRNEELRKETKIMLVFHERLRGHGININWKTHLRGVE